MHILLIISVILNFLLIAFVDFKKIGTINKLDKENKALKIRINTLKSDNNALRDKLKGTPKESEEETIRRQMRKQGYPDIVIDRAIEQIRIKNKQSD